MIYYIKHALHGDKPVIGAIIGGIMYIMFPERAYITAFCAVLITMAIDVFTKYYAIASKNGGFKKSFKEKHINSNAMYEGTKRKLISYMVIFILAGLSYRVAPIAGISVFLATTIYSVLFLRECQSILENLVDAGSDVGWLLVFVKKKQKKILDDVEDIPNNKDSDNDDLGC